MYGFFFIYLAIEAAVNSYVMYEHRKGKEKKAPRLV